MPKSTFFEAGTSLLKSYKNIIFRLYFHLVTSCPKLLAAGWLLAAALLRLLLLLLLANACETPPGSKTAWP